jgi:hypothetical protein
MIIVHGYAQSSMSMRSANTLSSANSRVAPRPMGGSGETNRMPLLAAGPETIWAGRYGPAVQELVSGSFGGGFVLLNDAGGDAPAVADRDALVFRPRADAAAVFAA